MKTKKIIAGAGIGTMWAVGLVAGMSIIAPAALAVGGAIQPGLALPTITSAAGAAVGAVGLAGLLLLEVTLARASRAIWRRVGV